jgi:hypothetical protein
MVCMDTEHDLTADDAAELLRSATPVTVASGPRPTLLTEPYTGVHISFTAGGGVSQRHDVAVWSTSQVLETAQ